MGRWTVPSGWTLRYSQVTTSTNDDARAAARKGSPTRTVFLSEAQTAGRGRLGRNWVAPMGTSLLFSLVLREPFEPLDLTRMAAVSVAQAIAYETGLEAQVKWPNDVMLGARKVSGILTESLAGGGEASTIVGIGINVNLDLAAPGLPATATSLSAELGRTCSRASLLALVLDFLGRYLALDPAVARQNAFDLWRKLLWRRHQVVQLADSRGVVEGVIEDVTPSGTLVLQMADGGQREVAIGELLLE